jgi:predicted membrane-bound spermidine synthase
MIVILAVFFLSGFSALVYQVAWQRSLFALFGINAETVTLVVTVFMVGLGIGSLAGGALSRRAVPPLVLFAAAEAGIGLFGLISLPLFREVGAATLTWPPAALAGVVFGLLLLPTVLMGATLPLLTTHLVRRWSNVGRSLATLYAVNTLGSAAAALVTAFFLLGALGLTGAVWLASAGNLVAAAAAAALALSRPRPAGGGA